MGKMYVSSKDRIKDKIETFAQFGATGNGGITRLSLSKEAVAARTEFTGRMKELGLHVHTDDLANMYATVPGSEEGLPRIVLASHLDSVRNAGIYDGCLGVIAAMEVVETLVRDTLPPSCYCHGLDQRRGSAVSPRDDVFRDCLRQIRQGSDAGG